MINYEEELKKFHSSLDVNEAEDAIYNRDLTDITDILKELMKDEKKKILIYFPHWLKVKDLEDYI